MTGPDGSDEDKGFLARWSQRKQEAKQPERGAGMADADVPTGPTSDTGVSPEVDLSSLPAIEDLSPTTDITVFLRSGVPEHLRNAALRKSWALDPAIRNYVSPALEYAYDWNIPGGVPGSSEIEAGMDVARLVSGILGTDEAEAEPPAAAQPTGEPFSDPANSPEIGEETLSPPPLPIEALRLSGESIPASQTTSDSNEDSDQQSQREVNARHDLPVASQQPVRRHGSAKPLV